MRRSMSIENEEKVVQTRLDESEYEQLRRVAEQEEITLKEALRRAATEFAERKERHDPDDPFFAAESPESTTGGEELTATKTEEYLYEE